MRISDWSSDVCSSDLVQRGDQVQVPVELAAAAGDELDPARVDVVGLLVGELQAGGVPAVQPGECGDAVLQGQRLALLRVVQLRQCLVPARVDIAPFQPQAHARSEEHTSELQSLMRISYAVFCLKKKNTSNKQVVY